MAGQVRLDHHHDDDDNALIVSLKQIAVRIPSASWWVYFDPTSTSSSRQHYWLRLPDSVGLIKPTVEVRHSQEPPKLNRYSYIIGRLTVLRWGTSCWIADEQITPSNAEQIICVEIFKEGDSRVFWTDIRRPELLCLMSTSNQVSRIAVSGPTRLAPGTVIGGWVSGRQYDSAQELDERGFTIHQEAFLVPVDFHCSLNLSVILQSSEEDTPSCSPINGCSSPVSSLQTPPAGLRRLLVLSENRVGCEGGGGGGGGVGENSVQTSEDLADVCASYQLSDLAVISSDANDTTRRSFPTEETGYDSETDAVGFGEEAQSGRHLDLNGNLRALSGATTRDMQLSETLVEAEEFRRYVIACLTVPEDDTVIASESADLRRLGEDSSADKAMAQSNKLLRRMSLMKGQQSRINLQLTELSRTGSDEGSGDSGMLDQMNGWSNRNDASDGKDSNHMINVIRKLFKLKKPVLLLTDYFQMLTGLLELSNISKELQDHSEMELSMLLHLSKQHLDDRLGAAANAGEPPSLEEARSNLEILLRFHSAWRCVLRFYSDGTAASWRDIFSARLAELEKATVNASQILRLTARASMEASLETYASGKWQEPQAATDLAEFLPDLVTLLACYLEQTSAAEFPATPGPRAPAVQLIAEEVARLESERNFLLDTYAWISCLLQMQPSCTLESLSRLQTEALRRYTDCLIFCQAVGRKSVLSACAETLNGAKLRLESSSSSQQLTHSELLRLSDEIERCETQLAVESVLLSKTPRPWQGVLQSWISGMKQEVDTARTTTQKALATLHTGHAQENQVRLQERMNDMRSKTDSTASFETLVSAWALMACFANIVDLDDLQATNEILAQLETTLMANSDADHSADIVAIVEDGLRRLPDILQTVYDEQRNDTELLTTSFSLSGSIARLEMERGLFAAPSMFLGFATSFFRAMLQQNQQSSPAPMTNGCLESLLGLLEQKHAVCVGATEAVGLCLKSLLGVKREFSELRTLICKVGLQDADAVDAATQALCEAACFASDVLRQETARISPAVAHAAAASSTVTLLTDLGSWMDRLKVSVFRLRHQLDELASSRAGVATQLEALVRPVAELQWLSSAACLQAATDLCEGDSARLQAVKADLAKRLATLLSQNSQMRRRDELNQLESLERQVHEQYRDTVALLSGCAEPSADSNNSLTPSLDMVCSLYDLSIAACPETATTPQAKANALIERPFETEIQASPTSNESNCAVKITAPAFFNFLQSYNVECVDLVTTTAARQHGERGISKQIELQEAVYRHEAVTSLAASLQRAPNHATDTAAASDQSAAAPAGLNRLLLSVWPRVLERLLTCARDSHAAAVEARIARLNSAYGHLAVAMRVVIVLKTKLARFLLPCLECQAPGQLCLGQQQQSSLQACQPTLPQLLQSSGLAEEISADFAVLKKTMKLFEADCAAYMQLGDSPAVPTIPGNAWIGHLNKISSMASLKFWKKNGEVVYQTCSRLSDHFDNYDEQVRLQVTSLDHVVSTLVRSELRLLKENLNAISQKSTLLQSSSMDHRQHMSVEECSMKVIQLETLLEFARETARILFTCLGASDQEGLLTPAQSKPDLQATPRVETPPPVAELARRAVDLKNSYEASEVGCQLAEAWQCLQLLADQLGEIQAGLPAMDHSMKTNYFPVNNAWRPQGAHSPSDALRERRRDWTLLDLLGPHDCVFPGCRGEQDGTCPHQSTHLAQDVSAETLLADLDAFYELLISEFRQRVLNVTCVPSNNSVFSPREESVRSLRADWHADERLARRWRSLRQRLSILLGGVGSDAATAANIYSELLNRLECLQTLWGTSPVQSADRSRERHPTDAREQLFPSLSASSPPVESHTQPVTGGLQLLRPVVDRLATVSSWVCELERQMTTEILPELQRGLVRGLDERIRPNPFFLSKVEACAEKMRKVEVDRVSMERSGLILPACYYASTRKALRLGWLVVREYILANCVEVPVLWTGLCGRHYHLLETYLAQTSGLDFDDAAIERKKNELCQAYVTQNLATLATTSEASGEVSAWNEYGRLYSTHGPLLSLQNHLDGAHWMRPPVAFTVFSLPDVSTIEYPTLLLEANANSKVCSLRGLKCGSIYSRAWMSMPELWSGGMEPAKTITSPVIEATVEETEAEAGGDEEVVGFQPLVEAVTPRKDPSEGSSSVRLRTPKKPVTGADDVLDSGFLMDSEGLSSRAGRDWRTHSFLTENSFSEVPDDLSLDENWEYRAYDPGCPGEIFQLCGQPIKMLPPLRGGGLLRSPESRRSFSLCSSSLVESQLPQTTTTMDLPSTQEAAIAHSEPDLHTATAAATSAKSWPSSLAVAAASSRRRWSPRSLPDLAVDPATHRPAAAAALRPRKFSATTENSSTQETTIPADQPARSVASHGESTDEMEHHEEAKTGGGREDESDDAGEGTGRESSANVTLPWDKEEEEEKEVDLRKIADEIMDIVNSESFEEAVRAFAVTDSAEAEYYDRLCAESFLEEVGKFTEQGRRFTPVQSELDESADTRTAMKASSGASDVEEEEEEETVSQPEGPESGSGSPDVCQVGSQERQARPVANEETAVSPPPSATETCSQPAITETVSDSAKTSEPNAGHTRVTPDDSPTGSAKFGPPVGWCTIMPAAELCSATFVATPDRNEGSSQLYSVADFPQPHELPWREAYAPMVCSAPNQSEGLRQSTETGDPSGWPNHEGDAGDVEPAREASPAVAVAAGTWKPLESAPDVEQLYSPSPSSPPQKDESGITGFPMNGQKLEWREGDLDEKTGQDLDVRPDGLPVSLEDDSENIESGAGHTKKAGRKKRKPKRGGGRPAEVPGDNGVTQVMSQACVPAESSVCRENPEAAALEQGETAGQVKVPSTEAINEDEGLERSDQLSFPSVPVGEVHSSDSDAQYTAPRVGKVVVQLGTFGYQTPSCDAETESAHNEPPKEVEMLVDRPLSPPIFMQDDWIKEYSLPSDGTEAERKAVERELAAAETAPSWEKAAGDQTAGGTPEETTVPPEAHVDPIQSTDDGLLVAEMPGNENLVSSPGSVSSDVSGGPIISGSQELSSTPPPDLIRLVEALMTHSCLQRKQGQTSVLEWESVSEEEEEEEEETVDGKEEEEDMGENEITEAPISPVNYPQCVIPLKTAPVDDSYEAKQMTESEGESENEDDTTELGKVSEVVSETVVPPETSPTTTLSSSALDEDEGVLKEKDAVATTTDENSAAATAPEPGAFVPTAPSDGGEEEAAVRKGKNKVILEPIIACPVPSEEAVFTMTPEDQETGDWAEEEEDEEEIEEEEEEEEKVSDDEATLKQAAVEDDSEVTSKLTASTLKPGSANSTETPEDASLADEEALKVVEEENYPEQLLCTDGSDEVKAVLESLPTGFLPSAPANQLEESSQLEESKKVVPSVENTVGGTTNPVSACKQQEALPSRRRRNRHKKAKPAPDQESIEVPPVPTLKDANDEEEEGGALFDSADFPPLNAEYGGSGANLVGLFSAAAVLPPMHSALITQSVAAPQPAVERAPAMTAAPRPQNQDVTSASTNESVEEIVGREADSRCSPRFEIIDRTPELSKEGGEQEVSGSPLLLQPIDAGIDTDLEMPELAKFWSLPPEDPADGPVSGTEEAATLQPLPAGEGPELRDFEQDSQTEVPEPSQSGSLPKEDSADELNRVKAGDGADRTDGGGLEDAPAASELGVGDIDTSSKLVSAEQTKSPVKQTPVRSHTSNQTGSVAVKPISAKKTERNAKTKKTKGRKSKKRPDVAGSRDQEKSKEAAGEATDSPEAPYPAASLEVLEATSTDGNLEPSDREKGPGDEVIEKSRPTAAACLPLSEESGGAHDKGQQLVPHTKLPEKSSKRSQNRKNKKAEQTDRTINNASNVKSEPVVRPTQSGQNPPMGILGAPETATPDSSSEVPIEKFPKDASFSSSAASSADSSPYVIFENEFEQGGAERLHETADLPSQPTAPAAAGFGLFGWRLPFSRSAQTSISLDPDTTPNVQVSSTVRSRLVETSPEESPEQRASPTVPIQNPRRGSLLDDVVEVLSTHPPPAEQETTATDASPSSPAEMEPQAQVRRRRQVDDLLPSNTVFGIEEIPSFAASPQLSGDSAASLSLHDPQGFEVLCESEYSTAAAERLPAPWVQISSEDIPLEDPESSVDIRPTKEGAVAIAPAVSVSVSDVPRKHRVCSPCLGLLLLLIPLLLLVCLLFPPLCPFPPPGPCPGLIIWKRLNSFLTYPKQPPI